VNGYARLMTLSGLFCLAMAARADNSSYSSGSHAGPSKDATGSSSQRHYGNNEVPKSGPSDTLALEKIHHGFGDGGTSSFGQVELKKNESLVSQNGRYQFAMQGDCNAVVYEGKQEKWSSKTFRKKPYDDCRFKLAFKEDSLTSPYVEFGVYSRKYHDSFFGRHQGYLFKKKIKVPKGGCWGGGYKLSLHNDGNLVLYCGKLALWDSQGNVK
jgi:hypothetical protein